VRTFAQSERATQNRATTLLSFELRYGYLGDWSEQRRNKTRATNQDMPQEYLTGRTRFV
jgi:hypothetical protein